MNNNDILRRLRFAFDFNDDQMINLFKLGGHEVTRSMISNWLKKDDHPEQEKLTDQELAVFLNGFIVEKRGKKDSQIPIAEEHLTNNIILRKLKIALSLKDVDILNIFELMDFKISKHELSAIFRHPNQSQYRVCQDQFLRNFLYGLQVKYRNL